jgi:signal transduction histidine kinase
MKVLNSAHRLLKITILFLGVVLFAFDLTINLRAVAGLRDVAVWHNVLLVNMSAILSIAVLFILLIQLFVSRPLKKAASALDELSCGNYHVRLKAKSHDDVGRLYWQIICSIMCWM